MKNDAQPAETELDGVVKRWLSRTRVVEREHFRACIRLRQRHQILGCVAVVASAMLGLFAHIKADFVSEMSWLVPAYVFTCVKYMLSFLVPMLTALISFLRFDERSGLHHNAGARFAGLKRQLQLLRGSSHGDSDRKELQAKLARICEKWDELTLQAPALYRRSWDDEIENADREMESESFAAQTAGGGRAPLTHAEASI